MNIPDIVQKLGWCMGVVDTYAVNAEGVEADLLLNVVESLEMVSDEILKSFKEVDINGGAEE